MSYNLMSGFLIDWHDIPMYELNYKHDKNWKSSKMEMEYRIRPW
jgi:hypothetical protein